MSIVALYCDNSTNSIVEAIAWYDWVVGDKKIRRKHIRNESKHFLVLDIRSSILRKEEQMILQYKLSYILSYILD
jgi:hypothetical protein